jgi:DNA invertase Pin-like site-specific DNA recombinase
MNALDGCSHVEFVSLNDGFDTVTATGRMVPKLLAVLAEWESDNLGERVRGVMKTRVREGGKHHGGRRPYGYEYRDGVLRPQPPVKREQSTPPSTPISRRSDWTWRPPGRS